MSEAGERADAAAALRAPATLDHATLDITAILRHVVDVETSLPPPRSSAAQHHASAAAANTSANTARNNSKNINTHPDVQMVQLPRYDRRRDETNFDDEIGRASCRER